MKITKLPLYCKSSLGLGVFHTVLTFCGCCLINLICCHLLLRILIKYIKKNSNFNNSLHNCSPDDNEAKNEAKSQLEKLEATIRELIKDEEITKSAEKLDKKLPASIRSTGTNSHVNNLKKRGYVSCFEDVDDSTGIKSAKRKIDNLINEIMENKQSVESGLAKESIENTESTDQENSREINLSDDSDSSDDSYEISRSRDSAPSPPSCNDAAENNVKNKDFLSDIDNNKEFVNKSSEAGPDQQTDDLLGSIFSDF